MMAHSDESQTPSSIANNPIKQPPCAEWCVWTGFEIEGTEDLGVHTLFVRSLLFRNDKVQRLLAPTDIFVRAKQEGIKRVWFCEEFLNPLVILDATLHFEKVCLCLDATNSGSSLLLNVLRQTLTPSDNFRVYLKLGIHYPLLSGDFVCIGEKYADTAYELPLGSGVTTELYEEDVRWY